MYYFFTTWEDAIDLTLSSTFRLVNAVGGHENLQSKKSDAKNRCEKCLTLML